MKTASLTTSNALAAMQAFANAPTAGAPAVKAETKAPVISAVRTDVAMPVKTSNRGSKSLYDFDALTAAGMSIGVTNKTAKQLSSIISNANRKAMVQKKDANGALVFKTTELKDAAGNVTIMPTTEPEMVKTKEFFAVDTDPKTDPDKATARIFRRV